MLAANCGTNIRTKASIFKGCPLYQQTAVFVRAVLHGKIQFLIPGKVGSIRNGESKQRREMTRAKLRQEHRHDRYVFSLVLTRS